MSNHIVVGGGIAGLLASILLQKYHPQDSVTLLEQGDQCGGLLGSVRNEDGVEFDFGTHIPGGMKHSEIDEILFGGLDLTKWNVLPKLTPGNVSYDKQYYQYCQLPYLAGMGQPDLSQATWQLLTADVEAAAKAANSESFLTERYGQIFVEKFFRPVMSKLQNAPLSELHPDAINLFGYQRILIGPAQMMRWLKAAPELDQILSFASYDEGLSGISHYYPNDGSGVRRWSEHLVSKAEVSGVQIRTNCKIVSVDKKDRQVCGLDVDSGEHLPVDQLYWTAPLFPLINMCRLDFESRYKPHFQPMVLHHMVYDKPFNTHNTHVYVNDAHFEMFRLTMYNNLISNEQEPPFKITVETLSSDISDLEAMQKRADTELRELGIVDDDAKLLSRMNIPVPNGFPVYTNQFVSELQRQHGAVSGSIDNVTLLGKASAKNFFMKAVLLEVFNTLTSVKD